MLDQNPIAFWLARTLYSRVERWCIQRGAAIVAVSSAGAEREVKQLFPGVAVAVTPSGVDLDRFRPDPRTRSAVRAEHSLGDEEVVALFVGLLLPHFGAQKGLPIAIEGLARARTLSNAPLRLWVLTRADPEPFRALARRLGVSDHVEVLGFTDEPERVYQAADIFVLPTLLEMFSLAACEAAACGLPLVTTRVPGMDELLGEGESGITVRPDADDVGAALARLATDPELRRRMGAAARERASRYTWDGSAASVLEVYRQLLRDVERRRRAQRRPPGWS